MTRDGCLQQDSLAHCIQKVPAKDGNGCSRPSPRCPLPWSPRIHKLAAGITAYAAGFVPRKTHQDILVEALDAYLEQMAE